MADESLDTRVDALARRVENLSNRIRGIERDLDTSKERIEGEVLESTPSPTPVLIDISFLNTLADLIRAAKDDEGR
jgi:hypothetical protein